MAVAEKLGEAFVELTTKSKLDKGFDEAKRQTETTANDMASKFSDVGGKLTKTLTPAAAGVAVAAGIMAQGWNDAQRGMAATTGATGVQLEGLMNSAQKVTGSVKGGLGGITDVMAELAAKTELTGKPLEDLTRKIMGLREAGQELTAADVAGAMFRWTVPTDQWGAALERVTKISQATGVPVATLLTRLNEFGPVMAGLGFNIDQAGIQLSRLSDQALPGLKIALDKIVDTGTTDVPGAFNAMIGSIRNAESDTAALAIGFEMFGARAAPALTAAIRNNMFSLEGLTAEVDRNKGSIMGTAEAHRSLADRVLLLKDRAAALIGPFAETAATVATIASGVGPVLSGFGALAARFGATAVAATAATPAVTAAGVATAGAGMASATAAPGFLAAAAGIWAVTWPILAVIAAIALVAGAVYLLITHWDTIVAATGAAWNWIKDHIATIAAAILVIIFGPFGAIVVAIVKHWDTIKEAAGKAWDWIWEKVSTVVDFLVSIPGRIGDLGEMIFGGIVDFAQTAIEWIGKVIAKIGELAAKIPGGGMVGNVMGMIPGFATGGVVPGPVGRPMLAVVHGGETVTPPGDIERVVAGGGGFGPGAGSTVHHWHIAGSLVARREFAEDMAGELAVVGHGGRRGRR